jgi:hypothetical protein
MVIYEDTKERNICKFINDVDCTDSQLCDFVDNGIVKVGGTLHIRDEYKLLNKK